MPQLSANMMATAVYLAAVATVVVAADTLVLEMADTEAVGREAGFRQFRFQPSYAVQARGLH